MKNTYIVLVLTAVLLSGAAFGAPAKKTLPWKKQPPPTKQKPAKPVTKPRVLTPTLYSGRAIAVDLSNHLNRAVWRLADTGPLPSAGGSLSASVGPTTVDNALHVDGAQAAAIGIGCVSTSTAVVTNFSAL